MTFGKQYTRMYMVHISELVSASTFCWSGGTRPVSTQFMADGRIGMMEMVLQKGEVKIVQERQYLLVAAKKDTQR